MPQVPPSILIKANNADAGPDTVTNTNTTAGWWSRDQRAALEQRHSFLYSFLSPESAGYSFWSRESARSRDFDTAPGAGTSTDTVLIRIRIMLPDGHQLTAAELREQRHATDM